METSYLMCISEVPTHKGQKMTAIGIMVSNASTAATFLLHLFYKTPWLLWDPLLPILFK